MRFVLRLPFRVLPASCLSVLALGVAGLASPSAQAHFRLLEPPSWVQEGPLGDPQKEGPCGGVEGAAGVTPTGVVTTYTAGETIAVTWQETVGHPGHFRISLTKPLETRASLVDPVVETDTGDGVSGTSISSLVVQNGTGDVLADNLFPRAEVSAASADPFQQLITLPDEPCEKCTLQVLQFMANHLPGYFYHHCADIRIIAKLGPDAADAGGTAAAAPMGSAGAGSAGSAGAGAGGAAASSSSNNGAGVNGSSVGTSSGGASTASSAGSGSGGSLGTQVVGSAGSSGSGPLVVDQDSLESGCTLTRGAVNSARPNAATVALLGLAASLWRRRAARQRVLRRVHGSSSS